MRKFSLGFSCTGSWKKGIEPKHLTVVFKPCRGCARCRCVASRLLCLRPLLMGDHSSGHVEAVCRVSHGCQMFSGHICRFGPSERVRLQLVCGGIKAVDQCLRQGVMLLCHIMHNMAWQERYHTAIWPWCCPWRHARHCGGRWSQ